jgi:hypothetical protein
LGHEAADAGFPCGSQQRVRAHGAEPVRLGEASVEVLEVAQVGERGRLVNDGLGLGIDHRFAYGVWIQHVEHYRLRPEAVQAFGLVGRAARAGHLVAMIDELRDESDADRDARPCDQDFHRVLLSRGQASKPLSTIRVPPEPQVLVTSAGFRLSLL